MVLLLGFESNPDANPFILVLKQFPAKLGLYLLQVVHDTEHGPAGRAEGVEIVLNVLANLPVVIEEVVLALRVYIFPENLVEIVAADLAGTTLDADHMVLDDVVGGLELSQQLLVTGCDGLRLESLGVVHHIFRPHHLKLLGVLRIQ